MFGVKHLYICPLCARGFDDVALKARVLTLEHVPPASIGGRGIVLTCKDCNSTAGALLDVAISQHDEQRQFMQTVLGGGSNRTTRAKLRAEEAALNVEVFRTPYDKVQMNVHGPSTSPEAVLRVKEYFESLAAKKEEPGNALQLTSRARYRPRHLRVAYLRAAYLAAFAAFGYRYALSSPMQRVVQQIRQPDEDILDGWTFMPDGDPDEFIMVASRSPATLLVVFRSMGVFLPFPDAITDIYAEVQSWYSRGEWINVSGQRIEWPTTLRMSLDLASDSDDSGV